MPSRLKLRPRATPAIPETDTEVVFLDQADGVLKSIDDTGTVTSLGSGGVGGLDVTDGVTTVAGATELLLPPGTVIDEGGGVAFHTGGFIASATDPGAVGAGVVWKDISGGLGYDAIWRERNAADDGWNQKFMPYVVTVDDDAVAGPSATATGDGNAEVSGYATAVAGSATAGPTAITTGLGDAVAGPTATADGDGNARSISLATANGIGVADVSAIANAYLGTAIAGSLANLDGVKAGMQAEVDGTSARMAFNGTTPIAKPVVPLTTPDAQDVIDALVALGLISQSD